MPPSKPARSLCARPAPRQAARRMAICWVPDANGAADEPEPGRSAPQLRSRRPAGGGRGGRPDGAVRALVRGGAGGRGLRAQRHGAGDRGRRRAAVRPAWCCSRASMPRASSSTPTWRAARRSELAGNPRASLLFWWDRLHRQVRIEGTVEPGRRGRGRRLLRQPAARQPDRRHRLAAEPGDRRPRRAGGAGRGAGRPPPRGRAAAAPLGRLPRCGRPLLEFWQGRPSRLHDRLRYTRAREGWRIERLAP